eukprot:439169_1
MSKHHCNALLISAAPPCTQSVVDRHRIISLMLRRTLHHFITDLRVSSALNAFKSTNPPVHCSYLNPRHLDDAFVCFFFLIRTVLSLIIRSIALLCLVFSIK